MRATKYSVGDIVRITHGALEGEIGTLVELRYFGWRVKVVKGSDDWLIYPYDEANLELLEGYAKGRPLPKLPKGL